jgi:hypothetical protein
MINLRILKPEVTHWDVGKATYHSISGQKGLLIIPDRLQNVYHEAAMKKTQIVFGWAKFGEGEKIFPMKRGPRHNLPTVLMKVWLIASGEIHIQQLADLQLLWGSRHKRLLLTCTKGSG